MLKAKRKRKPKRKADQQAGKYGCWEYFALISAAIFLLAVVSAIPCGLITLRILDRTGNDLAIPPDNFCTTEDEIYQAIIANKDDWLAEFRRRIVAQEFPFSITFTTSWNRMHYVNARYRNYSNSLEIPVLHVAVNFNVRKLAQEYVYSSSGSYSVFDGEVKELGNNVFCVNYFPSRYSLYLD